MIFNEYQLILFSEILYERTVPMSSVGRKMTFSCPKLYKIIRHINHIELTYVNLSVWAINKFEDK